MPSFGSCWRAASLPRSFFLLTPCCLPNFTANDSGGGDLKPLSDEERQQRWLDHQLWLEQCRQRDEEQWAESERQRAEALAAAQREAAVVAQRASAKMGRETQKRLARQGREREMTNLRLKVAQNEGWRIGVENAVRDSVRQQYNQTLMGELEVLINPPPLPEPEVVYVEPDEGSDELGTRDFNIKAWMNKSRSWW